MVTGRVGVGGRLFQGSGIPGFRESEFGPELGSTPAGPKAEIHISCVLYNFGVPGSTPRGPAGVDPGRGPNSGSRNRGNLGTGWGAGRVGGVAG